MGTRSRDLSRIRVAEWLLCAPFFKPVASLPRRGGNEVEAKCRSRPSTQQNKIGERCHRTRDIFSKQPRNRELQYNALL